MSHPTSPKRSIRKGCVLNAADISEALHCRKFLHATSTCKRVVVNLHRQVVLFSKLKTQEDELVPKILSFFFASKLCFGTKYSARLNNSIQRTNT